MPSCVSSIYNLQLPLPNSRLSVVGCTLPFPNSSHLAANVALQLTQVPSDDVPVPRTAASRCPSHIQALLDAVALGVGAASSSSSSLCSSLSHLMSEACVTSSVRCPVIKIMHAYLKYVGSRGCWMHRHRQRQAGGAVERHKRRGSKRECECKRETDSQ